MNPKDHPLFWTEREGNSTVADAENLGPWKITEVLADGRSMDYGVEADPYEPGAWRGFFGIHGAERMGLLPKLSIEDARADVMRCIWDLQQQARARNTRKNEIVISAALLAADYESPGIMPIDTSKKSIFLGDLFPGASWTWNAIDHLEAPRLSSNEEDVMKERILKLHENGRKETPAPRVYKIKISVEFEELPESEGQKLIDDAYKKSVEKNRREP